MAVFLSARVRPSASVCRAAGDGAIVSGLLSAAYLFIVITPEAAMIEFDADACWAVNSADPHTATAVAGRRRPGYPALPIDSPGRSQRLAR